MIKFKKMFMFLLSLIFISQMVSAQRNTIHYSEIICGEYDNIKCADKLVKELKIYEIIKKKGVYIIYGYNKENQKYTILSSPQKKKNFDKIKIRETYKFYLVPYLDVDMYKNFEDNDSNITIVCGDPRFIFHLEVENKIIKLENDGDNNFYGTPNLEGLYYIPYDGTEKNRKYPYCRAFANWVKYSTIPELNNERHTTNILRTQPSIQLDNIINDCLNYCLSVTNPYLLITDFYPFNFEYSDSIRNKQLNYVSFFSPNFRNYFKNGNCALLFEGLILDSTRLIVQFSNCFILSKKTFAVRRIDFFKFIYEYSYDEKKWLLIEKKIM